MLGTTGLLSTLTTGAAQAVEVKDVLGVAHAGGKYNFSGEDYLNEGADQLLAMGTRVIKVWLSLDAATLYPFNSDWNPPATTLVQLAQSPYYERLFAKPFHTFLLVVPGVAGATEFNDGGMTAEVLAAERQQTYDLAHYLLTTYAGSGKTFVIQNWEADHLLRQSLAPDAVPSKQRIQGLADWWNARQDGVTAARHDVGMQRVTVVHAAEVNLLADSIEGKVTATNDVVPLTRCDLYSYSSWDIDFDPARLTRALDYLAAKAPPSELYGHRNIYLGEFGAAKDQVPAGDTKRDTILDLAEAALAWGARFVSYWQLYDNEPARPYTGRPTSGDMRGFWLIRPDGTKVVTWNDFQVELGTSIHFLSLSASSGKFLAAAAGEEPKANQPRQDPTTSFAFRDNNGGVLRSGDPVKIQAHDGRYLHLAPNGALAAQIRATSAEPFTIWKLNGDGALARGDFVVLQASSGLFLTLDPATGVLSATTRSFASAEPLRVVLELE